jgi:hypothetical protein
MYVEESAGARHWLGVLSDLKQRGVQDILIACTDHLKGFDDAIEAVFPHTAVQGCIVHQIRNMLRHVGSKELKHVLADLQPIYKAPNEQAALLALEAFAAKWEGRYPRAVQSWTNNWPRLSTFLRYPEPLRKLDLHHQHHRGLPCPAAQGHQDQARLRWRPLGAQAHLPGAATHRPWEVAAPPAQLAQHILERRDPLHRPDQHPINSNEQVVSLPRTPSLRSTTTTSTKVN